MIEDIENTEEMNDTVFSWTIYFALYAFCVIIIYQLSYSFIMKLLGDSPGAPSVFLLSCIVTISIASFIFNKTAIFILEANRPTSNILEYSTKLTKTVNSVDVNGVKISGSDSVKIIVDGVDVTEQYAEQTKNARIVTIEIPGPVESIKTIRANVFVKGDAGDVSADTIQVEGDVTGSIVGEGNIKIGGNVSSGIKCEGNVTVEGNVSGGVNSESTTVRGNSSGDIVSEGNVTISGETNGSIKAEGNVHAKGGVGGGIKGYMVNVYNDVIGDVEAEGDVIIGEYVTVTGEIVSEGNVEIREGSTVTDDVKASGNVTSRGIIGGKIECEGNIFIMNKRR